MQFTVILTNSCLILKIDEKEPFQILQNRMRAYSCMGNRTCVDMKLKGTGQGTKIRKEFSEGWGGGGGRGEV